MAVTETEQSRFRRKLNGNETSMPDSYIEDVYAEAEELYPTSSRTVQSLMAYILGIRDLRMRAANLTDYQQNETSDKRSQLFAHLDKLEAEYRKQLDKEVADAELPPVMWGGSRRKPTRIVESPDDSRL